MDQKAARVRGFAELARGRDHVLIVKDNNEKCLALASKGGQDGPLVVHQDGRALDVNGRPTGRWTGVPWACPFVPGQFPADECPWPDEVKRAKGGVRGARLRRLSLCWRSFRFVERGLDAWMQLNRSVWRSDKAMCLADEPQVRRCDATSGMSH